jgi:hypothetical protein
MGTLKRLASTAYVLIELFIALAVDRIRGHHLGPGI